MINTSRRSDKLLTHVYGFLCRAIDPKAFDAFLKDFLQKSLKAKFWIKLFDCSKVPKRLLNVVEIPVNLSTLALPAIERKEDVILQLPHAGL